MILTKGSKAKVSNNFTENEFFSKSKDAPQTHYFDEKLIKASQLIRSYYNSPMRVNSSFRTLSHNSSIGGGTKSQHLLGKAVDLSFIDNENSLLNVHNEILTQGQLHKELRKLGITGFGLYDTFIHLDTRTTGGKNSDSFGKYAFWDNRITTKKKSPTITDIYNAWNDEEDGSKDFKRTKTTTIILISITILLILFLIYKKFKK